MTYEILTDHWKYGLFKGDIIPAKMYSPAILKRATEAGYIAPYEEAAPTMDDYKDDIIEYLKSEGIKYDPSDTKSELLDLLP